MNGRFTTAVVSVVLLLCAGLLASADVVIPIDPLERPIEGEVKAEGDTVVVTRADGTSTKLPRTEIAEISRGSLQELYDARRRGLGDDDIPGMLALAEWCRRMGLREKWAVLVLEVIRLSPDNETARTELGHIKVGGVWVAPEFGESFGDGFPDNLRPGVYTSVEGKLATVVTDTSVEFARFACDSLNLWAAALREDLPQLPWKRTTKPPSVLVLRDYGSYASSYAASVGKFLLDKGFVATADELGKPPEFSCFFDPLTGNGVTHRFRKTEGCSLRMVMQKALAYATYASCISTLQSIDKLNASLFDGFADASGSTWLAPDGHLRPFAFPQRSRVLLVRRKEPISGFVVPTFPELLAFRCSDLFLESYGLTTSLLFAGSHSRERFADAVKRDLRGAMKDEELLKLLGDQDGLRASLLSFWTPYWLRLP